MKYNALWNDEQSYMIRTTGMARWNTYMKNICSSGQKQNVAILFANRDIVFTTSFSLFTHDQIDLTLIQVLIPVWFVVFSRTFWDTFLCCLKNIIVKLFYNNIYISVIDLNSVS